MGVVALFVWLATAGAGLYLLAVFLIEYDRDYQHSAATRLPLPVLSGHAVLAVAGLAAWAGYLLFDNDKLIWTTVAILAVVAGLGVTMSVRWLGVRRATAAQAAARPVPALVPGQPPSARPRGPEPLVPPERHFPVSVVVVHGLLAVTTLTLVLVTAFSGS
jgi:hypothetical protein